MEEKRKKKGKREGKEFMDAVQEAYIRYLALERFRDVQGIREVMTGEELKAVLEEVGRFQERGRYREIWEKQWRTYVADKLFLDNEGLIFQAIEQAISVALEEEEAERERKGDASIFDERSFKAFVDYALGQLLTEAAGEIEKWTEEM